MVSRIICLSMLIAVASAATWMGHLPPKPKELAHKVGCYIQEINDVIPFDETVSPIGNCYRIECTKRMIYYASCGAISSDEPKCFRTGVDYSRPYPGCCPTIVCDVDNNLI